MEHREDGKACEVVRTADIEAMAHLEDGNIWLVNHILNMST